MSRRLLVAVAGLALTCSAAVAVPGGVAATFAYAFVPGDRYLAPTSVVLVRGTELVYVNADVLPHSVTALDAEGESPVFDSGVKETGESGAVTGTEALGPGAYPFYCSVHPLLMRGTLTVV